MADVIKEVVLAYLKQVVVDVTGIDQQELNITTPMEHYGINSTMIVSLNESLSKRFSNLPSTLFFEYQTLQDLCEYFVEKHADSFLNSSSLSANKQQIKTADIDTEINKAREKNKVKITQNIDASESIDWSDFIPMPEEYLETGSPDSDFREELNTEGPLNIAVIGMAGVYAGANNLNELWENISLGKDCISEVPSNRWNVNDWFDEDKERADRVYSKWGGFVEDIDKFDASFFSISPREANRMDPQERLFLQIAWNCIEHAGYAPKSLTKSNTGVFVGAMWSLYQLYGAERTAGGKPDIASSSFASIANRLSWFLDLQGPSFTLDSMCSSSLTAIYLACQSLLNRDCDQAIVGGVNLNSHPAKYLHLSRGGFAADDGRCRAFGHGGSGYVPGEGIGAVLLKPLHKAEEDRDSILAVIKGAAINHGGRTNGYTVPNPIGQSNCLQKALNQSQLNSSDICYVEAHGTGTSLGDPIEISGLMRAYFEQGENNFDTTADIRIGSIKSNIGHCESAAAMAGLHKIILQIQNRKLVSSLHAEELNKNIRWSEVPFNVQQELHSIEDKADKNITMSLSAFGAGGSNGHLIVSEYKAIDGSENKPSLPLKEELLVLSSPSEKGLYAQCERLLSELKREPSGRLSFEKIAMTLAIGRDQYPYRAAFIASSINDLCGQISKKIEDGSLCYKPNLDAILGIRDDDIQKAIFTNAIHDLKDYWQKGIDLDFVELWKNRNVGRVGLCGTQFDTQRYWLDKPFSPSGFSSIKPSDDANEKNKLSLFTLEWEPLGDKEELKRKTRALPDLILCRANQSEYAKKLALCFELDAEVVKIIDSDIPELKNYRRILDLSSVSTSNILDRTNIVREAVQQQMDLTYLFVSDKSLAGDIPDCLDSITSALIRLMPAEYSKLDFACCDMDEMESDSSAQNLVRLWDVFETAQFYRIQELELQKVNYQLRSNMMREVVSLDENRTHIVTGGTGGIGLAVAEYLCRNGAKHLILTGRSALPDSSFWSGMLESKDIDPPLITKLDKLLTLKEKYQTDIKVVNWDLENRDELESHFEQLDQPLGVVVHLAGSVDLSTPAFIDKSESSIQSVVGAKVRGAENLVYFADKYTAQQILLVSSQSAVIPSLARGVLDYAAANAALNDIASREQKIPVKSLMLPNWAGAGLGETKSPYYSSLGLKAVSEKQGLDLFDTVLQSKQKVFFSALHTSEFSIKKAISVKQVQQKASTPIINSTNISKQSEKNEQKEEGGSKYSKLLVGELKRRFAPLLEMDENEWKADSEFALLGVDSISLTRLSRQVEELLDITIAADILLQEDTLNKLAGWLIENHLSEVQNICNNNDYDTVIEYDQETKGEPSSKSSLSKSYDTNSIYSESPLTKTSDKNDNAVAVIGMGGLFPQAEDIHEFWNNLLHAKDVISEVPHSRWPVEELFKQGKRYSEDPFASPSKWGGFVDRLEYFDPSEFSLPAAMAAATDPLLRVALWSTRSALCDAGMRESDLHDTNTGVFIGSRVANWADRIPEFHQQTVLGTAQNFIAAHISHWLNINGPAVVVDTACSSSLFAIHQACRSLLDGDCSIAIAGGSEVLLDERPYQMLGRTGAMSPTGRCRTFDANADGFVPGEGGAIVILKTLNQALIDGDRIYSVIEGSAVNNDGRTMGVTTPNPLAQQAVIRKTLSRSNINSAGIGYIEAHGTGTQLGDPMELKGLTEVFRDDTQKNSFCGIGSVKSSVGHLLSAAGATAFIKTALCIHNKRLVPTLHCDRPNPRFQFEESPFFPVQKPCDFPSIDGVHRAGVSAFGFGGTNVHLLMSDRHKLMNYEPARDALVIPERKGSYAWYERPGTNKKHSDAAENTGFGFDLIRIK